MGLLNLLFPLNHTPSNLGNSAAPAGVSGPGSRAGDGAAYCSKTSDSASTSREKKSGAAAAAAEARFGEESDISFRYTE